MKSFMNILLSTAAVIGLLLLAGEASAQKRYSETLCQEQGYSCFKVPKGESWQSLFPDENQREVMMRINRMNISLRPNMVIALPDDIENMDYMQFTPFSRQIESIGEKLIMVDPQLLAFGAYDEKGNLLHWGPVAMGKNWCADIGAGCKTKTGQFAVYRKGSENCVSTKFPIGKGGAPMPYCMFFSGGYAIHSSTDVPGYHASHGCVRTFYEDAQWLNQEFASHGTKVVVKSYQA